MDKLSTKVEDFETRKAEQVEQIRLTHDSLVQSLRKEIEQGQIKIKQVESKLSVTLIDKILFASGKAEITPEGQDILTRVGKMLKNTSGKIIRVEGHTDNVRIHPRLKKKYASNWELSSARATVVVKHLQDKAKIPGKRLQAIGMSQYDPVESNATRKGRSMNRTGGNYCITGPLGFRFGDPPTLRIRYCDKFEEVPAIFQQEKYDRGPWSI